MSVLQVLYSDDLFKNRYKITENKKMLCFLDYIPRYIITGNSCSNTRYEVRFLGEMHLDSVLCVMKASKELVSSPLHEGIIS